VDAAGAQLAPEVIEIGEQVYLAGNTSGIGKDAWASLRRTRVFLKAPITTPSGGGYKSLNVTIRKTLGLYANVRPCVSYHPFVQTFHPAMNVVIVRENEEDLYAGIEHRQTDEVYQCLKLVSRPGCEKIIRYAFDYARAHGRRKVTCMTKDNIMKMTDGLFHQIFDEVRVGYPDIAANHMIIDIGAARLATHPQDFDVIVTLNLYGDIISDIAADLTGGVGLAGSANIGDRVAMFEAIHGSAPDIAGKNRANPSGLLLGAVQMLVHINQNSVAERVHNAWLRTIEEGVHTADLRANDTSAVSGTREFAAAVIARLGQMPTEFAAARYPEGGAKNQATEPIKPRPDRLRKGLVGVDIFVHAHGITAEFLAGRVQTLTHHPESTGMKLQMITNRGVKVWPDGFPETFCTDHWRCRFMGVNADGQAADSTHLAIIRLLQNLQIDGLDFIKMENLCTFDGEPGYALGQGQ
jgi:isocitrate dehydrogenase